MKLRISVEGKAYDVDVEVLEEGNSYAAAPNYAPRAPSAAPAAPAPRSAPAPAPPASSANGGGGSGAVKAPIVGTVIQVKVKPGDNVEVNQVLVVMEAMKMETNIASPIAGRVKSVSAVPGEAVKAGQVLVELE